MAFPFTVDGTVTIPVQSSDEKVIERVLRGICAGLETAKAKRVKRDRLIVMFRGGIFRPVGSWNPTYAISSGTVQILLDGNRARVSYRLRITGIVVIASIGVLWLAVVILSLPDITSVERGGILVALWLLIVGSNYLFIRLRFPKWLKRVVEEAKAAGG